MKLVFLQGPGGSGKDTLADEACARMTGWVHVKSSLGITKMIEFMLPETNVELMKRCIVKRTQSMTSPEGVWEDRMRTRTDNGLDLMIQCAAMLRDTFGPDIMGRGVAKEITDNHRSAPVVIVTGTADIDEMMATASCITPSVFTDNIRNIWLSRQGCEFSDRSDIRGYCKITGKGFLLLNDGTVEEGVQGLIDLINK